MPTATLQVLSNNNLVIKFNDTIASISPTDQDLYIVIYGPSQLYNFTWTASFKDSSTLVVDMSISSDITGSGEKVYVEFPYSNKLLSMYSLRQTNPDTVLSGTLFKIYNTNAVNSFGQTTLYIYLISVAVSMLSSFGGNSMELMWIFTNYLQLIFYISVINVTLPDLLDVYFPYVQICNANNPYLSQLSFMVIAEDNFTRGDVSSIGAKAFYVSAADKLPWLVPIVVLFCVVRLTDCCKVSSDSKCLR